MPFVFYKSLVVITGTGLYFRHGYSTDLPGKDLPGDAESCGYESGEKAIRF